MTFDADNGGGGASTPWYATNIEDMWTWVNRDLSAHYEQANSWKKAGELYGLYQYRLQAFRDKLAQSWNPATSPAAAAYLTKLDDLIKAVKNVDEVASRNYQAAVDIPGAISEAKYKLKPIYDAYKTAQRQHTALLGPFPMPSPSPSGAKSPSVVMGEKHNQAQSVMYQLSADLSRAQAALGRPIPYEAPGKHDDGSQYGGGGGMPMPMIPPVVPSYAPTPMPGGPVTPMPAPTGPDLSGLRPPLPGMPGQPGPGPGAPFPTPTPAGPTPAPAFPPGGVIPSNTSSRPGSGPRPGPGMITGALGGAPGRGVPGGVIGSAPASRGAGGVRPNPVGGVIGGATAGGRGATGAPGAGIVGRAGGASGTGTRGTTGSPGAGRGAAGAMALGGRSARAEDEDAQQFDPDTLWEVAQGVSPVVEAPQAQRPIDPGPAIGLSR